jgi:hypothetical protein
LVINKFAEKAKQEIMDKQMKGKTAGSKKPAREPKNFDQLWIDATHFSEEGWEGIPSNAFRNAMISACKMVDFKMTRAKLSIDIVPDGYDRDDGATGLVKITKGKPSKFVAPVRLPNKTADIRSRPRWSPGWEAVVTIEFDADQFTVEDIVNLLNRAGQQCGICEGRKDSENSNGQGWGSFIIVTIPTESKKKAS